MASRVRCSRSGVLRLTLVLGVLLAISIGILVIHKHSASSHSLRGLDNAHAAPTSAPSTAPVVSSSVDSGVSDVPVVSPVMSPHLSAAPYSYPYVNMEPTEAVHSEFSSSTVPSEIPYSEYTSFVPSAIPYISSAYYLPMKITMESASSAEIPKKEDVDAAYEKLCGFIVTILSEYVSQSGYSLLQFGQGHSFECGREWGSPIAAGSPLVLPVSLTSTCPGSGCVPCFDFTMDELMTSFWGGDDTTMTDNLNLGFTVETVVDSLHELPASNPFSKTTGFILEISY